MVDGKTLNILGIQDMKADELVEIGEQLGLEAPKRKSSQNLRNEIKHLIKIFLAGQVLFRSMPFLVL